MIMRLKCQQEIVWNDFICISYFLVLQLKAMYSVLNWNLQCILSVIYFNWIQCIRAVLFNKPIAHRFYKNVLNIFICYISLSVHGVMNHKPYQYIYIDCFRLRVLTANALRLKESSSMKQPPLTEDELTNDPLLLLKCDPRLLRYS